MDDRFGTDLKLEDLREAVSPDIDKELSRNDSLLPEREISREIDGLEKQREELREIEIKKGRSDDFQSATVAVIAYELSARK